MDPRSLDIEFITYKAVPLFSLASVAQRSELHMLDYSQVLIAGHWDNLPLYIGFMSKTQVAGTLVLCTRVFQSKIWQQWWLGNSDPDQSLCPIRALGFYVNRIESTRKGLNPRFLPLRATSSGKISCNTISGWLGCTILLSYEARRRRKYRNRRNQSLTCFF